MYTRGNGLRRGFSRTPTPREIDSAIVKLESRGIENCHYITHQSGEQGCRGYKTTTWRDYSRKVFGHPVQRTPENEKYVTREIIKKWQEEGKTTEEIFLIWNQGHPGECGSGVNGTGTRYNSCQYVQKAREELELSRMDKN